jgi:ABC-type amino acid transport substrate-binding protein
VVFRPVQRDELFSHLTDGTADMAIAGLTITSERRNIVDFSDPMMSGIDEIVVTGPDSPSKLQLHEEIIVNANGEFGWAVRQNTRRNNVER